MAPDHLAEQKVFDVLMRQNFLAFTRKAFEQLHGKPPRLEPHLRLFTAALEAIHRNDFRRLMLNAPPRSLKSFVLVVCGIAWILGRDPHAQTMIVTNDEKLGALHANMVRKILESDWYQRAFPATRLDPNHNRSGDFRTTAGGGVLARSMEASTTGHGADWIFVDDPHDAGDVSSANARQRAHDLLVNKFYQRLNEKASGRIVLVMQRLHPDDVAGREADAGYTILKVPLVAETDITYTVGDFTWQRKAGHMIDPQAYGDEDALRQSMPIHTFLTQYQQDAVSAGAGMLREDHFTPYAELPNLPFETFLSFDLNAGGTSEGTSYSCCAVVKRYQQNLYVVEVWRGRLEFEALKAKAIQLILRYPHARVLVEDAALGTALISSLRHDGHGIEDIPKPTTAKEMRLAEVFDVFAEHRVHVPMFEPWRTAFLDEMLTFPSGIYDDQVDALVQLLTWLKTGRRAPIANPRIVGVRTNRLASGSNTIRDPNAARDHMMARPAFKGLQGRMGPRR